MNLYQHTGDKLRKIREDLVMSQQELADLIGCNVRTIIRYEAGKAKPTRKMLDRYERYLLCAGHHDQAAQLILLSIFCTPTSCSDVQQRLFNLKSGA